MSKPSKSMADFIAIRDDEDLRSVLKETWGQRFISRILISCGVGQTPYSPDEKLTYMQLGKQSIGNALLDEVKRIKPEVLTIMAKMEREDEDARKLESEQMATAGRE